MTKLTGKTGLLSRLVAGLRRRQHRSPPAAVRVEISPPCGPAADGLNVTMSWDGQARAYEVALYDHGRRKWRRLPVPSARAEIVLPEGVYQAAVCGLYGPLRRAGPWSPVVFFRVDAEAPAGEASARTEAPNRELAALAREQAEACWDPAHAAAPVKPPRIVLVGGAPRSGTTLLQAILCADPAANPIIAEAAPLRALLACHAQMLRHHRLYPRSYFESEDALRQFAGETIWRFLDGVSKVQKCGRLVLKEPALTKYFPAISELIEDVGFVVIVRDPRDAIASMIEVADSELKAGRPSFIANRNASELCAYYNGFYFPLFTCTDARFTRALRYVRYEDLVAAPLEETAELAEAFGFDLGAFHADSPGWRSKIDFASSTLPSRSAVTELYGRPVSADSVGRYRARLDKKMIAEIERRCFPIMEAFGYVS